MPEPLLAPPALETGSASRPQEGKQVRRAATNKNFASRRPWSKKLDFVLTKESDLCAECTVLKSS